MNRQVVLEIGNTHVKAGLIEISSLPFKTFSSWGKRSSGDIFFSSSTEIPSNFDENLHVRALKDNQLNDFDFLIALIEYSIEKELEIPKESFEQVQLTLILPSALIAVQLPLRSKLIKSIYDRLKVSAVFLGEVACMSALGSAHGTALVLNFDPEGVEIAAVNDFSLVTPAVDYFSKPLNLHSELSKSIKFSNLNELLSSFDPSNDLSKETDVKFTLDNRTIPLSTFHEAFKNIFVNQRNFEGLNFLDVIETVIDRVDPDRRSITLNHFILNGIFPLPYPLLVSCLHSILASSPLMAVSDYPADTQPVTLAFRSIPDYYIEIKETGRESIAWFGASLAGKYAHSDSKTFIIPPKTQQQPQ